MISIASLIGLAGCGLFPASLVLSTMKARAFPKMIRGGLFFGLMAVAFIPVRDLELAGYIRGLTGDFSVTTWILLAAATAVSFPRGARPFSCSWSFRPESFYIR